MYKWNGCINITCIFNHEKQKQKFISRNHLMKMFYSKHTISTGLENTKVRSKLKIKAYLLKIILEYFF